jgi:phosphohistidine phosphatase
MVLYLVRDGEAKKETEDPAQGLTDKGREQVRRTASSASKLVSRLSEILHSPKARAQQTAEILAEHLKPERGTRPADHLLPLDDPGIWAQRVAGIREDVIIVSHLPFLAKLAGLLLCGDQDKIFVEFGAAGMLCLDRSGDGRWSIQWMIASGMVG